MDNLKKIEKQKNLGRADLHIHSNFSDAKPSIEEILEYVEVETDLDVIAIADHDTIEGAKLAQELVARGDYRFNVIVAEEVSSKKGHIVGLFLKERVPPGLSVSETLKSIKRQGGITVAVHPFHSSRLKHKNQPSMNGIGARELVANRKLIDAIEVINATPTLNEDNVAASTINGTVMFKAETGSSDAHILSAIGMGFTLFEGGTAKDLRKAIETRQTQAANKKWRAHNLLKYMFFYIPLGLRLLWNTFLNKATR